MVTDTSAQWFWVVSGVVLALFLLLCVRIGIKDRKRQAGKYSTGPPAAQNKSVGGSGGSGMAGVG